MPENLDRFRRMLVYRGAGLGRFHCIYRSPIFSVSFMYSHNNLPTVDPQKQFPLFGEFAIRGSTECAAYTVYTVNTHTIQWNLS